MTRSRKHDDDYKEQAKAALSKLIKDTSLPLVGELVIEMLWVISDSRHHVL